MDWCYNVSACSVGNVPPLRLPDAIEAGQLLLDSNIYFVVVFISTGNVLNSAPPHKPTTKLFSDSIIVKMDKARSRPVLCRATYCTGNGLENHCDRGLSVSEVAKSDLFSDDQERDG